MLQNAQIQMSQDGEQGQPSTGAGQQQAPAPSQPQGGGEGAGMSTQQQQTAPFSGLGGDQKQAGAPAAQGNNPNQAASAAALKGMGIDSSSAMLDACMRDLTRRRIAMAEAARYATGNPAAPGNLLAGLASPGFDFNMATLGMHGLSMRRASLGMEPLPHEDPATQQQRRISMTFNPQLAGQQFPQQQSTPGLEHLAQAPPANPAQPPAGAAGPRQWWVCRVCQSKAFASAEEASEHESLCNQEGSTPPPKPNGTQNPQQAQQPQFPQDNQAKGGNSTTTASMQPMDMSHLYPFLSTTGVPQASAQQPFNINISQDDVKSEMERFFQKQQEKIRQMQNFTSGGNKDDKAAQAAAAAASAAQEPIPFKQSNPNPSQQQPVTLSEEAMQDLPNPQTNPLEGSVDHATLQEALPLAMPNDKDWLTPLHCFVRRHCVEVFTATPTDVATPSKGKRKPIQVGQVGIRCPHCHPHKYPYMNRNGQVHHPRERGSVYYPTTIASIYNATMNLLQRHLHSCSSVPHDIMARYAELKADDARSGTSKKYWVDSAKSLGLIDTPKGIFFSSLRPPPLPSLSQQQFRTVVSSAGRRNSLDFFSSKSNAEPREASKEPGGGNDESKNAGVKAPTLENSEPLVTQEDRSLATGFSYELLSQMQPCVFTEADRLGKRKGLPPGFAGLACRHCFGGYGSGRFFPSSIKTLSDTSKTLNVLHNHMMRCRKCPREVRDRLEKLRATHDDERAKMKFGSQKAFFAQIWRRLHDGKDNADGSVKKKKAQPKEKEQVKQEAPPSQQADQQQQLQQLPMQQQLPPQLFLQQGNCPISMAMAAASNPVGQNSAVNAGAKRNAATMAVPQLPSAGDMKRMRASGA